MRRLTLNGQAPALVVDWLRGAPPLPVDPKAPWQEQFFAAISRGGGAIDAGALVGLDSVAPGRPTCCRGRRDGLIPSRFFGSARLQHPGVVEINFVEVFAGSLGQGRCEIDAVFEVGMGIRVLFAKDPDFDELKRNQANVLAAENAQRCRTPWAKPPQRSLARSRAPATNCAAVRCCPCSRPCSSTACVSESQPAGRLRG